MSRIKPADLVERRGKAIRAVRRSSLRQVYFDKNVTELPTEQEAAEVVDAITQYIIGLLAAEPKDLDNDQ